VIGVREKDFVNPLFLKIFLASITKDALRRLSTNITERRENRL
jgi:hypothetical protein